MKNKNLLPSRPGRTPSVEQLVQEAASKGLVEPELNKLPLDVANTLRSMIAGERPAPTLPPDAIARLGKVIAGWGVPHGRSTLGFGSFMAAAMAQMVSPPTPGEANTASQAPQQPPKKLSEALTENLGLVPDKAARVEAVAGWPIGFVRRDLAHWGLLSEDEAEAVWDYIVREHGLYTTGTLYAAP